MLSILTDHWQIFAGVTIFIAALFSYLIGRRQGGDSSSRGLGLEELVSLDSKGWAVMTLVAVFGAVIMIGSSAGIGVDYWTGLAINADVTAGSIKTEEAKGFFWFLEYMTVGVVAFFFLAITFELFSDLGTPMASGLKQRKKRHVPELVFAATVGCIIMSLVTKWGYYDDKRDVRRVEVAQTVVEDSRWVRQREEAQAIIDTLGLLPSRGVADAREVATRSTIESLEGRIEAAEAARDAIPASHSTNRTKAQEGIDALSVRLTAAREGIIEVAQIKSNLSTLEEAKASREEAVDRIKETAGMVLDDGRERTRAGDLLFVRILRVGLHQFLCWLFPLVALESFAAWGDARRREESNRKRRKTREVNANTFDAEFEEVHAEPLAIDAKPYYEERTQAEEEELEKFRKQAGDDGGYENGDDRPAVAGDDEE